ncbi:MAG TPA: benzoate-CoA ligase family protein [Candidatus Dormibacteraeota bacterium]
MFAGLPDRYNAAVDILDSALEAGLGAKVAVRTASGDTTYNEVAELANRWGNALAALGVEQEDRVLVALLDTVEFPATFFGAIKAGAVPIPVNTNLTADDYAYYLADSRAKVVIVSEPLLPVMLEAAKGQGHLKHVIADAEWRRLVEQADPELTPADTGRDDMCFWLYTSGTTGRPKAAVHLQHDMRFCIDCYAKPILNMTADDVTFSVAKLYFAYGLGNALFFPFAMGATTVLNAAPPTPPTVIEHVRRFRPTIYYGVPTSYAALLAAEPEVWAGADFSSVRVCVSAGEPLSGSLLERWKARTGVDILDGIGSTECAHIFITNRLDDIRPDCSGRVVEGYGAKVVDDQGVEVPDGEVGNLMVSGDSICAFYWNQHERTKAAIKGEWIDTGDKYTRDSGGYFRYQGRSDDMLKVSGIWVSPVEVEAAINSHPAVLESAVVGVLDENRLVRPEAHVVLQPGSQPAVELEEELRGYLRERLAHHKCPREFHFVDSLPKTATGKIQRYLLREAGAAKPVTA